MAKITIDIEKPAQWVSKLSRLYFADQYARRTEGFPTSIPAPGVGPALRLELQTYKVDIKTEDKGAGGSVCLGHFADKDNVSLMFLFPCTIGKHGQTRYILDI